MTSATIEVNDWDNIAVRDSLMDEFGNEECPFFGQNEDGESVEIHVSRDSIVIVTMQNNGWVRKNYYYYGEEYSEEIFDGKWK